MNKNIILSIETSTASCSVALSAGYEVIGSIFINEPKAHASRLAPMVSELLSAHGTKPSDLAAVAVSEGPGSYTGLRVGVSTAKGICYGSGAKLLGISTLEVLARMAEKHIAPEGKTAIIPMIDARRMEVYCAIYDTDFKNISETEALVLDENSFGKEFEEYDRLVFIGDGAEKFSRIINNPKAVFICESPSAEAMAVPAYDALEKGMSCDIAYFEPRYLKEFVAGVSKKKVL